MNTLQRIAKNSQLHRIYSAILKPSFREFSSKDGGDDDWNDAWETAWLPEDLSGKAPPAPWEADVNFSAPPSDSAITVPPDADSETKAFVEDMNDNWSQRRKSSKTQKPERGENEESGSLYSLENMKKDYRLTKQRIHAGLWMKEIEKQEEAKLADSIVGGGGGDDIERLLDSCSE